MCAFGVVANLVVADYLFEPHLSWWLTGLLAAVVGAVWNFGVSSEFAWTEERQRRRET